MKTNILNKKFTAEELEFAEKYDKKHDISSVIDQSNQNNPQTWASSILQNKEDNKNQIKKETSGKHK